MDKKKIQGFEFTLKDVQLSVEPNHEQANLFYAHSKTSPSLQLVFLMGLGQPEGPTQNGGREVG